MAGINGADVLLRVNTGTDVSPTYETVASQRNVSFERTAGQIDVSSKDSDNEQILLGRKMYRVRLDGLWVPGSAQQAAIKSAFEDKTTVKVRRRYAGSDIEEADAYILGITESFPDQAEGTINVDIKITAGWSAV